MNTEITATASDGSSISVPVSRDFPLFMSLVHRYLDLHGFRDGGKSGCVSNEVTADRFRQSLKQAVIDLRDIYKRRNVLLDQEYELLRPPLTDAQLQAQLPPMRFFIACPPDISGSDESELSENSDVPPGMVELQEIRFTRGFGDPDSKAVKDIVSTLNKLAIEYRNL